MTAVRTWAPAGAEVLFDEPGGPVVLVGGPGVATAASPHPDLPGLLDGDYRRWCAADSAVFRDRLVTSRTLAKAAVAAVSGIDPADVRLGREATGRPVVTGPDGHDVGITHTGAVVAVAAMAGGRIGIDVEWLSRPIFTLSFARAVCGPAELAEVLTRSEPERTRRLVWLWTAKEATAKAIGTGLTTDFRLLRIDADPSVAVPDRATAVDEAGRVWSLTTRTHDEHAVTIATGHPFDA